MYKIPFVLRFCLFLLFLFVFNISSLVKYYLSLNYFPDEIVLWALPCGILFFYNLKYTISKISKNTYIFIILAVLFFITEKSFVRGYSYIADFSYLVGFIKFYTIFFCISLIPNRQIVLNFILIFSQKLLIPLILFFYFDYFFGGNKLNNVIFSEGRYINNLNYHVNGLSFAAVYGVFSTIVSSNFNKIKYKSALFRILFFLGIIALNSSRGAFLMAILILLLFLKNSFSKMKKNIKPIVIFIIPIIVLLGAIQFSYLSNDILVINRIVNNDGTGRQSQAEANLIHFSDSPYIGKGQSLGGVNDILGTRGSNVHYTQALASYGLFLGLFYILFMLNIFGPIKTKINNEIGRASCRDRV